MPSNEFLDRRIGQRIDQSHIEVFRDREGAGSVSALWLRFVEGGSLVLGCAGDGGIFSRKAEAHVGPIADFGHVQQEPVPFLSGATLEAVEPGVERLTLRTSKGVVTLRNVCDELVVEFSEVAGRVA
jgi:hypothetical protein